GRLSGAGWDDGKVRRQILSLLAAEVSDRAFPTRLSGWACPLCRRVELVRLCRWPNEFGPTVDPAAGRAMGEPLTTAYWSYLARWEGPWPRAWRGRRAGAEGSDRGRVPHKKRLGLPSVPEGRTSSTVRVAE